MLFIRQAFTPALREDKMKQWHGFFVFFATTIA